MGIAMRINVDLEILTFFTKPQSVYDLYQSREAYYGSCHSCARHLLKLGLIKLHSEKRTEKNLIKKLYILTERGKTLLSLFDNGQ